MNLGTVSAMTPHASLTTAAGAHELVAAIERSQILLTRPAPSPLVCNYDKLDIAMLEWIVSHARGVRQFRRLM
jgi:hypothetical protein